MVDKRVLDVLVCPACRTAVRLEGERLVCRSAACGLRYPIRDDIPIMLIQEAEKPARHNLAGGPEGRGPATGSGHPAST